MQDIPVAQILVLIAFILFPLLSLLMQRTRRRVGSQMPRNEPLAHAPLPTRRIPRSRTVAEPAVERGRDTEGGEAPPPRRSPAVQRSLFRTPRDLRRAVILMTVLGPPRAYDQSS